MRRFVAASWPALVRLGAPQPLPDKVPEDRLSFHAEPEEALTGVDFVQENAPERVEVKRALLARLDAALPSEVIIASSSSGLLMSTCRQIAVILSAA